MFTQSGVSSPGKRVQDESLARIAQSLKAISHPARLAILDLLKGGNLLTVTEIHTKLRLDQAITSQHLSILRAHEIVSSVRQGKNTYYFLRKIAVLDIIDLMRMRPKE